MINGKKSHSDVLQYAFKAYLNLALLPEVATNTLTATTKSFALLKFLIQTTATSLAGVLHV